jgi:hypothetical protein
MRDNLGKSPIKVCKVFRRADFLRHFDKSPAAFNAG